MFVNFAIQGLNDLFAAPDDDYQPPRSYTRLTMRDEAASYSSRPGSEENSVGDGYAFTIDAHRRYGIPQMWAMNGGLAICWPMTVRTTSPRCAATSRRACSCPSSPATAPTACPTTAPARTRRHPLRRPRSWRRCSARPGRCTTRTSG